MGLKENNRVRTFGVIPAYEGDPIPVRLATEAEGAGMKENNRVRTFGVIPAEGADPIPVSGMLYPSPLSIPPPAFIPIYDIYDWHIVREYLKNRTTLTVQYYVAPVNLPNGVTVTKLTLYGYRDDALSGLVIGMDRGDRVNGTLSMSTVTSDWITGWSSKFNDSITASVIDNNLYHYTLILILTPNDSVEDVKLSGVKIEFT